MFRWAMSGVAAEPWSLSNVGGVPLTVRHGKYGPGLALRYHGSQSTVGAAVVAGLFEIVLAHTLSNP